MVALDEIVTWQEKCEVLIEQELFNSAKTLVIGYNNPPNCLEKHLVHSSNEKPEFQTFPLDLTETSCQNDTSNAKMHINMCEAICRYAIIAVEWLNPVNFLVFCRPNSS